MLSVGLHKPMNWGASAIECQQPHSKSPPRYSLRLDSRLSVLPSKRSTNHSESQLTKPTIPAVGKSLCRIHQPPWLLKDKRGEASSIPLSDLGETICSNIGTPYHQLQHTRSTFDEVTSFSVENVNKSAIAQVK